MRFPLQVSLSCFNGERKGSNMYSPPLSFLLFSFADWPHGQCINQANLYKVGFPLTRKQGRNWIFCNGGALSRAPKARTLYGVSGCPPPEKFQVWRFRNAILALVIWYVSEKSTSNTKMHGKQLQVTIIKITKSKENNSIHRLDVSGSTGPGGQLPPLFPR